MKSWLYWDTADTDPSNPEYVLEFARIWKNIHKIVFSKTLEQVQGQCHAEPGQHRRRDRPTESAARQGYECWRRHHRRDPDAARA